MKLSIVAGTGTEKTEVRSRIQNSEWAGRLVRFSAFL